ncbi:hypothetical protein NKW84_18155, partial [Acetobacter senegalensis]|nr:hypothetical protein [Acetobacter senegalensis]
MAVFAGQSCATGYTSRHVKEGRSAATGIYLTYYYLGRSIGAVAPAPCLLVMCESGRWKRARPPEGLEPVWEHGSLPPSFNPEQLLGAFDPARHGQEPSPCHSQSSAAIFRAPSSISATFLPAG